MAVYLPKGTRDALPETMRVRQWMVDRIRSVFERFGFGPLQTPAFERLDTLLGKYGDEGQKLIFKILKRGAGGARGECDLGLRYDLTVPLARVVAMNPQLRLPFKRYQIAQVWRAERPGKGRYREFTQCDADIVGTQSVTADAECVAMYDATLVALGLTAFTVRINDRRVLRAVATAVGAAADESALLIAVDKLDKIGVEGVSAELTARGFGDEAIATLWQLLDPDSADDAPVARLRARLLPLLEGDGRRSEGAAGLDALDDVVEQATQLGAGRHRLAIDPTLARGLDYYTGPVFEVAAADRSIGSLGGGGRYDGLVGRLSGRNIPAVGCSLGLDRIQAVMEELGLISEATQGNRVLVTMQSDATRSESLAAARTLRAEGIATDLYPEVRKLGAQLKYANAGGFRWAVLIGESEATDGSWTVKDLRTGVQRRFAPEEALRAIGDGTELA